MSGTGVLELSGTISTVASASTTVAGAANKTLTLQENKARAVVAGERAARTPRFVKTRNGATILDETSLARARGLLRVALTPKVRPLLHTVPVSASGGAQK